MHHSTDHKGILVINMLLMIIKPIIKDFKQLRP